VEEKEKLHSIQFMHKIIDESGHPPKMRKSVVNAPRHANA
jgi:hypothetical protein